MSTASEERRASIQHALRSELEHATKDRGDKSKQIGNYIVEKTLGEGSFGKVKQGKHIHTGQTVAIKVLEKSKIRDVDDMERVAREIKILKLLNHDNIVKLFEVIDSPTHIHLIIEYAAGGELFDYIVAHGRVKEKEARRFFRQIIGGVDYCHRLNIIHRDLKPENLLLDKHRNIKIVDFGLSNTVRPGNPILKTACGSPAYAAPEMIAGKEYTGFMVDIWSMGVILFALICGYLPFEDPNVSVLCQKIVKGDYAAPDFISKEAKDLIKRMLTTNPKKRITLEKIRKHAWFNKGYDGPPDIPHIFTRRVSTVDLDLIKQMEEYGFDGNTVIQYLTDNVHNHATATYMLLVDKKEQEKSRNTVSLTKRPLPAPGQAAATAGSSVSSATPAAAPSKKKEKEAPAGLAPISEDGAAPAAPSPRESKRRTKAAPSASKDPAPRKRRYSIAAGGAGGAAPPANLEPLNLKEEAAKLKAERDGKAAAAEKTASGSSTESAPRKTRRASIATQNDAEAAARAAQMVAEANRKARGEEGGDDKPLRMVKGAFSVSTTSTKPPKVIMQEVKRVLGIHNIGIKTISEFYLKCESPTGIRFELEICALPNLTSINVVRLKRITGDTWQYKELCGQLVAQMKL